MRYALLLSLVLVGGAAGAQQVVPAARGSAYGPETVITQASGGSLREWQRGPNKAGYLFVKNRTEQWYRVELTGPCQLDIPLDSLSYTTDVNGTFDRFSTLRVGRLPNQTCGIRSIRKSTPPAGRVGVARGRRGR